MPLYEYECRKCHHRFEVIQSFSDKPIRKCPNCKKGTVQKLLSSPALRFKGSGFYITDYGGKKAPPGEGTSGASGGESSGKEGGSEKSEKKSGESSGKSSSGKKSGKKD